MERIVLNLFFLISLIFHLVPKASIFQIGVFSKNPLPTPLGASGLKISDAFSLSNRLVQ